MELANTLDLVRDAQAGGYAVPAVNIVDDVSIRAVVAAAEEARSPVILQTSVKTVKFVGADLLHETIRRAAAPATVPVSLHLDHCPDRAVISECIRAGWGSVLFDASDRPLDQAWSETKEVVAEAHAAGVTVESEIENIVGVEDGVGSDEALHAYTDDQLLEVARDTGVDLLAPALGTAHGEYTSTPVLQIDRVRDLRAASDIPIVLHGGTGLTEADFRGFIDAGVSKINISTALKMAYLRAAQAFTADAETTGKWEPITMFNRMSADVKTVVREHIALFGSGDRIETAEVAR